MSVPISGMSNASPHHPIGPIRRVVKVLQEVKEPGLMQSIFVIIYTTVVSTSFGFGLEWKNEGFHLWKDEICEEI